ncbi:uncharacterized protein LOC117186394 [Drosophila miranda]|uniref:uncharacterized protein LOC117186394 n=1 Tax=Drosophila miranda TaxID=7229 RepID=UPI00143F25A5|nr:uncharacterized protein LOC117186394 [Drosophila miranda]
MSQSKHKNDSVLENKRQIQTQESVASQHVLEEAKSDATPKELPHDETRPATDVTIYNAYNMGTAFGNKFPCSYIRYIMQRVLTERLISESYVTTKSI